ncbi:MAG: HD domain-containing phosphohydrolase [Huintestinicola sp.]
MIYFYSACLLISFALLLWLHITDVRESLYQYIMVIVIVFSNLGYLSLAYSTNLEEALVAQRLLYVGGCFLPMLYFLTVCEICHIKLNKILTTSLICLQSVIYMCVCTIGKFDIYYKDVQFFSENGVGYLKKVYGPAHVLQPATMVAYFVCAIAITVYSINKKKSVNRKGLQCLALFSGLALSCYFIDKLLPIDYDIIPISYLILMVGALYPIYQSNMFTVYENKDIVNEQLNKIGFITFDSRFRYMGCNEFVSQIFPELPDNELGKAIPNAGEQLREYIIEPVKKFAAEKKHENTNKHEHKKSYTFKINDRYYDSMIHTVLNFRGKCVGYTTEITDETEHYRSMELFSNYNETLAKEVSEKTNRIRDIQQKTILGMAQMVESRDMSTGGHIKRTSEVVRIFSNKLLESDLGFDKDYLELVVRSAPMHDLGKIGVDDAILRKQGKFTDEEYEKMKTHSEIGAVMVKDILTGVEEERFIEIATNVAHYHHEKVNGKGYPMGLKGDEIPVEARIMALADVFDALVSKRCYKEAFTYDKAFSIIKEDSGTHFDPALAEIFLKCRPELEEYYNAG